MSTVSINTLLEGQEISEIIDMMEKAAPGKYELKEKYLVIKEMTIKKKIYIKGSFVFMHPSTVDKDIKKGIIKVISDQEEKRELVRKIKLYIDFRGKCNIPEVEFSEDFNFIKVYERK